jgi:hypothetical protein
MSEWQPIATAPRDGTIVELTWMGNNGEPQEIWPMQWGHIQRNKLFAGDTVGMWVMPNGGATWTEHDPDGAPTHWRAAPPLASEQRGTE